MKPSFNKNGLLLFISFLVIGLSGFAQSKTEYEKSGLKTISAAALVNGEKEGWQSIEDFYNRNTTTLTFQIKMDTLDFKTDTKGLKYCKTAIRFGFKEDAEAYELTEKFYILKNRESSLFGDEVFEAKNPALLFTNETFYIFIPNYQEADKQEALMYTYKINKGLIKEMLWQGNVMASCYYPYFAESNDTGFALYHVDAGNNNLLRTYMKNGKWQTVTAKVGVVYSVLQNGYREQIKPAFFAAKPEKYKNPGIADQYYAPIQNLAVFTNSAKDQKRLAELKLLKEIPASGFASLPMAEWPNYKIHFSSTGIDKDRVIYQELPHSSVLVPYMPATKQQDPLGTCVSYAYGALYKQFIDSDWQLSRMRKMEPNALQKETDISYFGMQQYLRGNKTGVDPENLWMYGSDLRTEMENDQKKQAREFDFDLTSGALWFPFEMILQNENNLDAVPYFIDKYYFAKNGSTKEIYELFRTHLEQLYETNKNQVKSNAQYVVEINELHKMTGIPVKNIDLNKAFSTHKFSEFLYVLFFNNCTDFITLKYRNNFARVTGSDENVLKEQTIKILNEGKPVLASIYCLPNLKKHGHSVVICGYKKVKNPVTGELVDVFKIKNSWGTSWDHQTNDGWFLADNIIYSIRGKDLSFLYGLKALDNKYVENTEAYKRIYKNTYTSNVVKYAPIVIGSSKGSNQKDASVLTACLINKDNTINSVMEVYKSYFSAIGYQFVKETVKNVSSADLYFDGLEIWLNTQTPEVYIICKNEQQMESLKSKMDFSKIKGQFVQKQFTDDNSFYLLYDTRR
jgi:hypothetical protein